MSRETYLKQGSSQCVQSAQRCEKESLYNKKTHVYYTVCTVMLNDYQSHLLPLFIFFNSYVVFQAVFACSLSHGTWPRKRTQGYPIMEIQEEKVSHSQSAKEDLSSSCQTMRPECLMLKKSKTGHHKHLTALL